MTVEASTIHRWIWDEIVTLPDPSTILSVCEALVREGSVDSAASLLDRAWGSAPTHRALQDARAKLLDSLALTEHEVVFRYIPAGWFRQGSEDGDDDERPRRRVELDAFWIAEEPLTWTQLAAIGNLTPPPELRAKTDPAEDAETFDNAPLIDNFLRRIIHGYSVAPVPLPDSASELPQWQQRSIAIANPAAYAVLPAVGVSYELALSLLHARDSHAIEYTLPTEAQWERAARGGLPDARYPWGDTDPSPRLADYERFEHFSIRPVRELVPNAYGLFAMAGTVREWCTDVYDAQEYQQIAQRNPQGPSEGAQRVARGGSWADCAATLRVSFRGGYVSGAYFNDPTFGVRPIRRARRA